MELCRAGLCLRPNEDDKGPFGAFRNLYFMFSFTDHPILCLFVCLFVYERERNINVWLCLTCPQLGTYPATQACALTRNGTGDLSVRGPMLKPLNHTSQGQTSIFFIYCLLSSDLEDLYPLEFPWCHFFFFPSIHYFFMKRFKATSL